MAPTLLRSHLEYRLVSFSIAEHCQADNSHQRSKDSLSRCCLSDLHLPTQTPECGGGGRGAESPALPYGLPVATQDLRLREATAAQERLATDFSKEAGEHKGKEGRGRFPVWGVNSSGEHRSAARACPWLVQEKRRDPCFANLPRRVRCAAFRAGRSRVLRCSETGTLPSTASLSLLLARLVKPHTLRFGSPACYSFAGEHPPQSQDTVAPCWPSQSVGPFPQERVLNSLNKVDNFLALQ